MNEPGLGEGIYPGMALTPIPSSIGRDSNPQPSNRESSTLTTRPDFSPIVQIKLASAGFNFQLILKKQIVILVPFSNLIRFHQRFMSSIFV